MFYCAVFLAGAVLMTTAMDGPLLSTSILPLSYNIDVGFLYDENSLHEFVSGHLKRTPYQLPFNRSEISAKNFSMIVDRIAGELFQADISSVRSRHSFYMKDFDDPQDGKYPMFFHFVGLSTVQLEAQNRSSSFQILAGHRMNIARATVNNILIQCNRDVVYYQLVTCQLDQVLEAGSRINVTFAYTSYFDDQCITRSDIRDQNSSLEEITNYVHSNTCKTETVKGQTWNTDADDKVFLYTSFEPEGARDFFPSMDEPRFKSIYIISVTAPKNLLAISNEAVATSIKSISGTLLRTEFKATKVPLSTYLVTVVIGRFTVSRSVDVDGIPWRVIRHTPIVRHDLDKFERDAKSFMTRSIKYYEAAKEMLQVEPGLTTKMDSVGIFGFNHAMENPGLITYQDKPYCDSEELISQYDGDLVELKSFELVFYTVAHEIAHQWFGNLVTMPWWNELWLNEGLSSWMEIELQRVMESKVKSLHTRAYMALRSDYMISHSLEAEVVASKNTTIMTSGYNIFSRGAYSKGASVLQMLQTVVGRDVFQAGIRTYIKEFSYSIATSDDFFRHIQRSVDHHGVYGPGERKLNVMIFVHDWIYAESVPVVSVYRDMNKIHFSQEMKWNQAFPSTDNKTLWDIPISLRVQTGNIASLVTFWLTERNMTLDISYDMSTSLVFLHDSPYMLYKVNYDQVSLDIIYDMFTNNCAQTSIESLWAFQMNQNTMNSVISSKERRQITRLCKKCLRSAKSLKNCSYDYGQSPTNRKRSPVYNLMDIIQKYKSVLYQNP